jgi:hypothetical protein
VTEPNYIQYCSPKELASFAQLQYPIKIRDSNQIFPHLDPKAQKVFILGHARQPFVKIIDINTEKMVEKGQ